MKALSLILILAAATTVGACQTLEEKRRIDYGQTRTLPPLEVPPDLASLPQTVMPPPGTATTYSEIVNVNKNAVPAGAAGVLPQFPGLRLARDGQLRYLVVQAPPERLWPRVRDFVLSAGLLIDRENPATGVIETDWAENRANVGRYLQRKFFEWFGSLYSAGTRDKYRIWLERGAEPGTTEIYIAHLGLEEVVAGGGGSDPIQTFWQRRNSEPALEAEMLRRLMVHLGATEAQAKTEVARVEQRVAPARAHLTRRDGQVFLSLEDGLERAWRRVGLSLDRIGFTVEDRDRSRGVYYVRYIDPEQDDQKPGFFSRLFSSDDQKKAEHWQYQIQLKGDGVGTAVQVLGKDGAPETSKTGERILSLLYEQLK